MIFIFVPIYSLLSSKINNWYIKCVNQTQTTSIIVRTWKYIRSMCYVKLHVLKVANSFLFHVWHLCLTRKIKIYLQFYMHIIAIRAYLCCDHRTLQHTCTLFHVCMYVKGFEEDKISGFHSYIKIVYSSTRNIHCTECKLTCVENALQMWTFHTIYFQAM